MASTARKCIPQATRSFSRICKYCAASRSASRWPHQFERSFTTTPRRRIDDNPDAGPKTQVAAPPDSSSTSEDGEALRKLVQRLKAADPQAIKEDARQSKQGVPYTTDLPLDADSDRDFSIPPYLGKVGFWGEGEPELGPDEDYYADDITSLGHGDLELHREHREYARLITWELPLLNQLARPFELPTAATPFRFRYTSYLGESHPAVNKVVVEFCPSDIDLTPSQRDKLIKLAGPRYNPSTEIIRMSCEKFDTQSQNKRHLGDTIGALLAEARDGKDTFQDVPFDFRHHKPKPRYEFPKEWILTPERKKYLEEQRAQTSRTEDERSNNAMLVDGETIIDSSFPLSTPEPELVTVKPGRRGAL